MVQNSWDAPKTLRQSGLAPADMDDGLRELVKRYDLEAAQGRHPSTLTIQWDDATLSLEGPQWQAFKAGKGDLMDLGGSVQVKPGAIPVAPKAPALTTSSIYLGCGLLAFMALLLLTGLILLLRKVRKPKAAPIPPPLPRPTALSILNGDRAGQQIPLGATLRIGRDQDNELVLASPSISRHHALIQWDGQRFVLSDLGSANGTFLENTRLPHPVVLQIGVTLGFGEIRVRVI